MHREVGNRSMRDTVACLGLPGGGKYQSVSATQHNGRTQVDEVEDDLTFYRDPGYRAKQ